MPAPEEFRFLDGTAFCLVYMELLDPVAERVKLTTVHGTARVLPDRLVVEESSGRRVAVPASALAQIHASDGNPILKDARHYVIVKISGISG